MMKIPEKFRKTITSAYGHHGQQWLQSLPQHINILSNQWQLSQVTTLSNLSYNYLAHAVRTTTQQSVVIKIGFDQQEIKREAHALQCFAAQRSIYLIDYDENYNALLVEYIQPGTSLASFFPEGDEQAIVHYLAVMKQLHAFQQTTPPGFPSVHTWLDDLLIPSHIDKNERMYAYQLASDLLQTSSKQILLHGDLHQDNILFSQTRDWLAIDPKGVIGPSIYEVGAFIRNPIDTLAHHPHLAEIIRHRVDLFSHYLTIDPLLIKQWSYVQALLAACWMVMSKQDPQQFLAVTHAIKKLLTN